MSGKIYSHIDKIPSGSASRKVTEGCLVLEGGAFRGLYSQGFMDAMMKAGINMQCTIGVSAGAMAGMNYVAGQIGRSARVNLRYRHDSRYVGIQAVRHNKGLIGFDTKEAYGPDSSSPVKVETVGSREIEYYSRNGKTYKKMGNKQIEMGKVSNLITDMTLKGATEEELTRAIRHSMVVIDAEKHALDYKQSEIDNGIASLKKKYQGSIDKDGNYHEGASTLISRAKSETQVYKRKGSPIINEDGSLSYKTVKEEYVDKNGKLKFRMQNSTKMAEAKDARELSSGTPQEEAYADYANTMKSLANQARREMINTGKIAYSAAAKNTYHGEVKSLSAKLNIALSNAPRERQAQVMANATVAAKKKENPDMTKAEIKKANQQALSSARTSVGAHRTPVEITDREWEAIQAGAISENKLIQILNNTNIDTIRQRATPRATNSLSTAKQHRISAMCASGYTTSEIADALGVSTSTVSKYLNGKG